MALVVLLLPLGCSKPPVTTGPDLTATPGPFQASTTTPVTTPTQISVDDTFNGKSVTMSVGDILVVTLLNYWDGGYIGWKLDQISNASVLATSNLITTSTTTATSASSSIIVGGPPQTQIFEYKALKSGTSSISLEDPRFRAGSGEEDTFQLTVNVQ